MRLLEQLLDTRNGRIEDVGDIFRAFIFVGTAFRNLEYPGFGQVEQIFAGTPCGSKPASAISLATEIISRTTARSRTISA